MKFDAVQSTFSAIKDKSAMLTSGLEASGGMKVINVDDESMNVALITDKMIIENGLEEVTNPIFFEKGYAPTPDGLFSDVIFGTTPLEKRKTHAYINLKQRFFHPYVYEVIKKMYAKVDRICAGESSWFIEDTGTITEIKDKDDKRYDENNTGLAWFIDNFKKVVFKETDSNIRAERMAFIAGLTDEELFITKWIVIPVFFRDVDLSSGNPSVDPLNYEYKNLIQLTNSLSIETADFYRNKAMFKIQMTLINIRKFGQSLIEKKKGAFHQSVLGKSIDYGTRSVISVPSLNGCETPDDCIVDILHTGIPLTKCCEIGYPLVSRWVLQFFEREFTDRKKMTVHRKNSETGKTTIEDVEIMDQMEIFTKDYIDKKIKWFGHHYGGRFEPIKIKLKDGTEANMLFTGRGYSRDISNPKSATISQRPMTWTDVFYLAAEETLTDKHVYCTRYPLPDYFGTFPSKCAVLSTLRTSPVIINGKVYPHYPIVDASLDEGEVTAQFIDTVSISNLYLEAIGGDYDGDMISIKMVYSVEANEEADRLIHDIRHYLTIQGNLVRELSNESYLTFYNMTNR